MINTIIWYLFTLSILYPIDPLYLNNLIDGSDIIVEAQILKDSIFEEKDMIYAEAELRIKKIAKGNVIGQNIKVTYDPRWSCPEGPSLVNGQHVIAFIKEKEDNNYIYGLSYGTKYFETQDLRNQYIQRISKYLELINEEQVDSLKIVDWLINNLQYETTDRETIRIINQSISNQEYLDRKKNKNSIGYQENIFPITRLWTNDHKSIIRDKILSKELDSKRYSWKLLCDLYMQENSEFEKLLIEKLPEYLDKEYYHGIKDIVETLEFKEKELIRIQQQIVNIPSKRENYQNIRTLTIQLNELLTK